MPNAPSFDIGHNPHKRSEHNNLFYDNRTRLSPAYRVKTELVGSRRQTGDGDPGYTRYKFGTGLPVSDEIHMVGSVAAAIVPVEGGGAAELGGQGHIGRGRATAAGTVVFRGGKGEANGDQEREKKQGLSHVELVLIGLEIMVSGF